MLASRLESSDSRTQYCIRAALAEARLMTAKQASDQTRFLLLAEELRSIEQSIASLEPNQPVLHQQSCLEPDAGTADWQWMRAKSAELDRRLRQIELNSPRDRQSHCVSTARDACRRKTAEYPRVVSARRHANVVPSGSTQQKKRA